MMQVIIRRRQFQTVISQHLPVFEDGYATNAQRLKVGGVELQR
jgi:hypothetical protein